jgi:2'-5' RNA ligase
LTQPEPVVGRPRETALSIVVPEAEEPTAGFRARFLERAFARRIPAHVTLLYPFADADSVDAELMETLRALYASAGPFTFELTLLEEHADGTWAPRAEFPLGTA